MGPRLLTLVLVLALAVTAGVSRSALDVISDDASNDLLYLPNGKHLKILSLGHETLLADMIFLWAIQYYSNYEREDRYRYVEHVFGEVITELDPHYIDAYWLGAMILIIEANDIEAGVRLLDKGAQRNPDQWILPYLAAWECFHAGQYERAEKYFDQASRIPGTPGVVRRMRAGMQFRTGRVSDALAVWQAILDDPSSDALSVKIAGRKVRELVVTNSIEQLEGAIKRFRDDNHRNPTELAELVSAAYIRHLPQDPNGEDYLFDPRTGKVFSSAGRLLGDR